MDYSGELTEMGVEQLEEALSWAKLQLDDVLYERRFTLGQTGIHLGGRLRTQLEDGWSEDERHLRERIAAIRRRLAELDRVP